MSSLSLGPYFPRGRDDRCARGRVTVAVRMQHLGGDGSWATI